MKIIKSPVLTEKTLSQYKKDNKVTFVVDLDATKDTARKAVEQVYGVEVKGVTVTSRLGKHKYNRLSKKFGKRSDRKIMVFTLAEKSKLDLFETK